MPRGETREIVAPVMSAASEDDAAGFGAPALLNWVWSHGRSESLWLLLATLTASGVASLSSLAVLYASRFIDEIGGAYRQDRLFEIAAAIFAIMISLAALRLATATLAAYASTNIRRNLEISVFKHLARLPFDYLEEKSHGRLTAAVMAEIPMAANIVPSALRSFVRAPATVLFLLAVLVYRTPMVALAALLIMPVVFLGLSWFAGRARKKAEQSFGGISSMYMEMSENLGGIRVVRCLGLLDVFTERLSGLSREVASTARQSALVGAFQQTAQELISISVLVVFLAWLALRVTEGRMDIGEAMLVPAALFYMRSELLVISGGYVNLRKTEGAARRLAELLEVEESEYGDEEFSGPLGEVRFDGVDFAFANGNKVLEAVDLTLRPGGVVVIVGESGAGKSTLCDLALRLRHPSAGRVTYNGVDLSALSEESVRAATALVEQEPYLFEGTIRRNLELARPGASEAEMEEALQAARALHFIRELPEGLDAEVGQRGVKLSVGQKQRIVLARALIRKPRFLVLDEFTSSLDLENEAEIIDAIARAENDAIVLCVTHRASIIEKAREVYMLRDRALVPVHDPSSLLPDAGNGTSGNGGGGKDLS